LFLFYGEELSVPCPAVRAGGPHLDSCPRLLIQHVHINASCLDFTLPPYQPKGQMTEFIVRELRTRNAVPVCLVRRECETGWHRTWASRLYASMQVNVPNIALLQEASLSAVSLSPFQRRKYLCYGCITSIEVRLDSSRHKHSRGVTTRRKLDPGRA